MKEGQFKWVIFPEITSVEFRTNFGMTKTDFGMYLMKGLSNISSTITSTCTINST